MVRVIFCDISGTLVDSVGNIDVETINDIKLLSKQGIKFVLCSGGSRIRTMNLAKSLGLSGYIISSNGGDVYDLGNKCIYSNTIKKDSLISIYDLAVKNNLFFTANCDNIMLVNRKRFNENFEVLLDDELSDFTNADIVQCIISGQLFDNKQANHIIDTLNQLPDIKIAIKNMGNPNFNINYINNCYCDIVDSSTSKGKAAQILLEYLGIDKSEAIAIGDGENDVSLFQSVQYGIAMENAVKSLKENATFTTSSNNENGVGKVLKRIL